MQDPQIDIYTTPTCPDCLALKRWLRQEGLNFIEHDLRDPVVAEEARKRTGVRVAPITLINGRAYFGTFAEQRPALEMELRAAHA